MLCSSVTRRNQFARVTPLQGTRGRGYSETTTLRLLPHCLRRESQPPCLEPTSHNHGRWSTSEGCLTVVAKLHLAFTIMTTISQVIDGPCCPSLWVFMSHKGTIEAGVLHVPCFCQAYLLSQVVTSVFRDMGRQLVEDKLESRCA